MKRCLECFHEYEDNFLVCPHCGTQEGIKPEEPIHLPPGTVLMDRYIIGKSIGAGGFGIVYKAWDNKLENIVAVKEFFVSRLVTRAAGLTDVIVSQKSYNEFTYRKDRFLAEARTMAKFGDHRSIPNVFEFFEENNTAYIVMELLNGMSLNDYIKQNNGVINIDLAVMIANEVGNALKSLHDEKIIHRDVAPDNVFICSGKDIKIKLMDLGAAKLADATDDVIDIILKPGFSPPEQYDNSKNIGPWTDIYALGATLYNMVTGIKPDESTNRKIEDNVVQPSEIISVISENLNNTVMKAMAVDRHMRFKNINEFLQAINGERKVIPLSKEKKIRKLKRALGIVAAFAVILASAATGMGILNHKVEEQQLKPADISVWFSVENGSNEEEAMENVRDDFISVFSDVSVELKAIPADKYNDELNKAAEEGKLPDLFESTDADSSVTDMAIDLTNITSSEQFANCLFLNADKCIKKIPLAIEIPAVFVVTNGAECIDYEDKYFSDISDFNYTNVAVDERCAELWKSNLSIDSFKASRDDFMNNLENRSAVLLSSTMQINECRNLLTNYEKTYVYPNTDKIICKYTYEWSIGTDPEKTDETAASERLLCWMLGNVYQNTLMVSRCSDGQIPVNKECFRTKIEAKTLNAVSEIYEKFYFESEE